MFRLFRDRVIGLPARRRGVACDYADYVVDAGPEIQRLYEFQVTHGELMRYMPCFCGCGANAGHRSNRDCYVRQINADGSVVFDSMAPT